MPDKSKQSYHRLSYDAEARLGIIKCMPSGPHEVLLRGLEWEMTRILQAMNLVPIGIGSKKFTNAGGSSREGDSCWRPEGRSS